MAAQPLQSRTSTIDIYIKLAQYPILSDQIRERMRQELFRRGVISEKAFEAEVRQGAIESQRREGIHDPFSSEPAPIWQQRKERIRDFHTDFYFGYNLPRELFEQIIEEVLQEQPVPAQDRNLAFNPEIAPWSLLFQQGEMYERLPSHERAEIYHHLEEIKVVLIKGMISDQLPYIGVAKKVFTIADLRDIHERRIGEGKIGGKAAGMLLAWKILQRALAENGRELPVEITVPESCFLGTDMLYEFHQLNNLEQFMNQKYRPADEIRADYPRIVDAHLQGSFPARMVRQLAEVLRQFGNMPVIVRSSSLLEDNFGHAFAGKYQSHFCPNQGTPRENLDALLDAIRRVYASGLNPDALLYRERHGLLDYDERMAVLIQPVHGQAHGRYFFPTLAGVGFSNNPFRWHPKIRRDDGFLRMVWGLGTRAVDRVSDDYPRMISLSHPLMRPETSAAAIRRYSQHYIDVIDLEANEMVTLPVKKVMRVDDPFLRYIASQHKEDYVQELVSTARLDNCESLVLTFDALARDKQFIEMMRWALDELEQAYQTPVDIEYAIDIVPGQPRPSFQLVLLQCRPLSERATGERVTIPAELPEKDILFRTSGLVPEGKVKAIRYLVVVDPRLYPEIEKQTTRLELGRAISRLNKKLENERYILLGPGRWGSANIELGVRVGYADIFNTKVLIEMAVAHGDAVPELSYGTHFFQDLVESGIHSLPLHLQNPRSHFDWTFYEEAPDVLAELSPGDATLAPFLKVIDLAQLHPPRQMTILMDSESDQAVGFLEPGPPATQDKEQLSTF
ncbi:MAG: PEP/pyruvate-binding domain-containing protein [Anaerolineae bacterium]|nr:PEP/pyruvate-binding domain-containing protein [Anaerolineae bacterium]